MDRDDADRELLQIVADAQAGGGIVESGAVTQHSRFDEPSVMAELRRLMDAGLLDGVVEEGTASPSPAKITNLRLTPQGEEVLRG